MSRYDLSNLPLCGAKTRNGTPCKRKGSKKNGRCRLHGGRSSGPKTLEGKLRTRQNAYRDFPLWAIYPEVDPKLLEDAKTAFSSLHELMNSGTKIDWDAVIAVVAKYRVAIEINKYTLLPNEHAFEVLMILQTALDQYYQEVNSEHLKFHLCQPLIPFKRQGKMPTKPQKELIEQHRLRNPWPPWHYDKNGYRVIFTSEEQRKQILESRKEKNKQ